MKKFKELLFLSNIPRLTTSKIHKEYIPALSRFKGFDKFMDFLKKDFDEDKLDKALEKTEKTMEQLEENEFIAPVTVFDRDYPNGLRDMGNRTPLFLYGMGNTKILNEPNLAVIGTRKPDLLSQNFEYNFTRRVIEQTERIIVSGMALGCDKVAHMATVDSNERTIAVLPYGLNRIEPDTNVRLAKGILESEGCLISAFPMNSGPSERSYVIRNEYVAALGDCTFAVQCMRESGTMKTVNFADKYGRRIACFLPEDTEGGDFTGNRYILNNDYAAFRVAGMDDLDDFLDYLNGLIEIERRSPKVNSRDYQSTLDHFYSQ